TFTLFQLCTVHGDKGRTEPIQTGIVFVAARLIDRALAAPFGLQRLYRYAIRFHAAVAAALTNEVVNDHPLVGVGERAALTPAAFLGSAGLIVNEHAHARNGRQLPLDAVKFITM